MTRSAAQILVSGANGVTEPALADLRRAIHEVKALGLHRLIRAGDKVLTSLGELREQRSEFSLDTLTDELRELLLVANALQGEAASIADIGVARRAYEPVGDLLLTGICTEPVVSGTGYSGVSTLVVDGAGQIYTMGDIQPGGSERVEWAYTSRGRGPSHRELCRSGLQVLGATASADGRLGSGAGVSVQRIGPAPLQASLFVPSLAEQAARGRFLFLRGEVVGASRDALVVRRDGGGHVRIVPGSEHVELAWLDNLRLLARAPGLSIWIVGRRVAGQRGAIAGLCVGPAADGIPRLDLPKDWAGRCNLGMDRMLPAMIVGIDHIRREVVLDDPPDPLGGLRRRVARVVAGGRETLPADSRGIVEREVAALARMGMTTGADALAGLADAAADGDVERLWRAWLAASVYERAASRAMELG